MDTALQAHTGPATFNQDGAQRLAALRTAMAEAGVDGYLIPHGDDHQGEFIAPYAERIKWLTNFTGSAGIAVVLKDRAAIFIDGRYTLQVRDQVDGTLYEYRHLIDEPASAWLAEHLSSGMKLGFDPKLHTPAGLTRVEESCAKKNATLVALDTNLVDKIWTGHPARPKEPAIVYPEKFAGRSGAEKRDLVAKVLRDQGQDAFLFTALDSIAWLFNLRGGDVEFSPLLYAYALLFAKSGKAALFVDPDKINADVRAHLGDGVVVKDYDDVAGALKALPQDIAVIGLDRDTGSRWITDRVTETGRKAVPGVDPATAIKARKHPAELQGVREAHIRDGAALTKFLAWIDREGPKSTLNEISAADRLAKFRGELNTYRGPSFATICGAGANGAIVHYRATERTAAKIAADMVLLVDSGGQYLDGTTDVTRSVAIGTATPEQKRRFTLVLKGHIALANAKFVKGTTGGQLDALARFALWQEGLDYDHGTGHGVGTFLGVHEGPQRIGKAGSAVALEPGMVISNEPGYYKTGEYGIRIENLVAVREAADTPPGAEKPLLEFETITMAPIDLDMVDASLLTAPEKDWLNRYHAQVRAAVAPQVDAETKQWLEQATRAI